MNNTFKIPLTQSQRIEIVKIYEQQVQPFLPANELSNRSGLFVPIYQYINQQLSLGLIVLPDSGAAEQTRFWFSQAQLINENRGTASNFVIREVTRLGLLSDGKVVNESQLLLDVQTTSNAIGLRVYRDLLEGGVRDVGGMLQADISKAISVGNMTLGGWGGSFFFWDVAVTLPDKNRNNELITQTIGQWIRSDQSELNKFRAIVPEAFARAAINGPSQSVSDFLESLRVYSNAFDVRRDRTDLVLFREIDSQFIARAGELAQQKGTLGIQRFYEFLRESGNIFLQRNNTRRVSWGELNNSELLLEIEQWVYPAQLASLEGGGSIAVAQQEFVQEVQQALLGRDLTNLQVVAGLDGNPLLIFGNGDVLRFSRTERIVGTRTVELPEGGTRTYRTNPDGTRYEIDLSADRQISNRRNYGADGSFLGTFERIYNSSGETEVVRNSFGDVLTSRSSQLTPSGNRIEISVSNDGTQVQTEIKPDGTILSRIETGFNANGKFTTEQLANGRIRELTYAAQIPEGGGPPIYSLVGQIIRFSESNGTVQVVERYDSNQQLFSIDRTRDVTLENGAVGVETVSLDMVSRTQTTNLVAVGGAVISTTTTQTLTPSDNARLNDLVSGLGGLNGAYSQWIAGNKVEGAILLGGASVNVAIALGGESVRQSLGGVNSLFGGLGQLINLDQVFSRSGNEFGKLSATASALNFANNINRLIYKDAFAMVGGNTDVVNQTLLFHENARASRKINTLVTASLAESSNKIRIKPRHRLTVTPTRTM